MYEVTQSSASAELLFLMVSSSDHLTGLTGLSPAVTIRKVGGSFTVPSGTISEVGNGWYRLTGSGSDVNTLGPLALHAEAPGADPSDTPYLVVSAETSSSGSGISGGSSDIAALAATPKRVRTDEGTVEERSVKELIDADQYNNAPDTVPYGIRVAKVRYGSTAGY